MKTIAGDFNQVIFITPIFSPPRFEVFYSGGPIFGEKLQFKDLAEVSIADEENVKRVGGTIGWGIAGAALLGPAGMLAGLLLGGKSKDVTFIAKLKNGRKFMATCTSKEWKAIQAARF